MATASSVAERVGAVGPAEPVLLEVDDARWRTFVAGRADALAYHEPRWAELLAACYGFRAFAVAIEAPDGTIAAGIPVIEIKRAFRQPRWASLPYTDLCPPLGDPDTSPALVGALDAARREAGVTGMEAHAPLPPPAAGLPSDAVLHTLDLRPGLDAVFATFHPSQVRRNVRRAEREGVVVRTAETEEDVARTFYALHTATRRRLGIPVQPRRFFVELWRRVLEPGLGFVLLASVRKQPVAGAVFLRGHDTLTYKFGASDAAFWSTRPNHLLFATAIARACDEGYRSFDFGRSDNADEGLIRFKRGWGTREAELVYSRLGEQSRSPERSGRALHVLRAVIRKSPTAVCRAAGELLYRYAA